MKGTIAKCLEGLVKSKGGEAAWKQVLTTAGLPDHTLFTTTSAVADADVGKLVASAAKTLGISEQDAIDAFGFHWSTVYAPGIYGVYFERAKSAKAFLLSLDDVHVAMTKKVPDAAPPRFRYEDKGNELVMHYASPRGMVGFMPGLIRGVAAYFKEKVEVRTEGNSVHVVFG